MARKTASRLELRRQAEAAGDDDSTKKKKKATKRKTTRAKRTKEKEAVRKRLLWGVFSGSMKEEGRFNYDQLDQAEEKIEQLKAKNPKRMYFIQPIKEALPDGTGASVPATPDKKPKKVVIDEDIEDDEADDEEDVEEEEDDDEEEE